MKKDVKRYITVGSDLVDDSVKKPIVLNGPKSHVWSYTFYGLLIVFLVAFNLMFSFSRVSGRSMQPTLHNNDYVLFLRTHKVKRFDVVSLRERLVDRGNEKLIVKRVIGLPGDRITSIDGQLYVNNEKIAEKYLDPQFTKMYNQMSYTITVPKVVFLFLGIIEIFQKIHALWGRLKNRQLLVLKFFILKAGLVAETSLFCYTYYIELSERVT